MNQFIYLSSPTGEEFHINIAQVVKVDYAPKAIVISHSNGSHSVIDKGHEGYLKNTLEGKLNPSKDNALGGLCKTQ